MARSGWTKVELAFCVVQLLVGLGSPSTGSREVAPLAAAPAGN
jgi:hypothetical protein